MKKRIKVFHLPGSPMAKSLQRWKELWETNPESMELRRKRGVEKRRKNCGKYKDHLWNYFVSDDPGTEITPEYLNRICYHFANEKRNQGSKWTKLKSFKRFLTKNGFIKYDFERDLYFNCYKIKRLEEIRAETDRSRAEDEQRRVEREAQQAEDERLRLERLEAYKVEREAQRIKDEAQQAEDERLRVERVKAFIGQGKPQQAEAKPPQAHRETQPQQGTQAEPGELQRLKDLRVQRLRFLDSIRKEVLDHPEQSHTWEPIIEKGKLFIADLEIKISELEKCEAKLSV